MSRSYCLDTGDCKAAKPTTHCRRCAAARMSTDPEIQVRRREGIKRTFAEPEYRARKIAILQAGFSRWKDTPVGKARMVELANAARAKANEPAAIAKYLAGRKAAGRKRTQTVLPWCPPEYLDAYRVLLKSKGIKAAAARVMIEELIAADHRRYLATGLLQEARRAA